MNAISPEPNDTRSSLAKSIAGHRFAAGMKPEHLKILADAAMYKQFRPEEIIFHEGGPANRFYLITKGKVALESRGDGECAPAVQLIGADDVLGWSWLFPPYYWHFSARALESTESIFFYATRIRAHCDEDPVFGYELMKRVSAVVIKRLQITRAQLVQSQRDPRQNPVVF
jgi:CRP-like cAMP-binding protein